MDREPGASAGPEPIAVGYPFGTRYQIIRQLGVGGMGAVYQAWDQELSVVVALKVIRPEVAGDPHSARMLERRFKQELLLARQVTHKNVVRIHDLGEINGIKYITMPYIDGEDLATILRREGKLPVRRVLQLARTLASGLAAAHAAGVVHRDLKPANIMIDADGEAMIMDFGVARSTGAYTTSAEATPRGNLPSIAGGHTVAGMIVGTVEYMAPEQARAQPVDHRADIYAFGLILYDMLLGRKRALRAQSALEELQARTEAPPPPVRTIEPDVPEHVDRIVTRCIQPDAEARYATTGGLVADLERLDEDGHPLPIVRRLTRRMVVSAMGIFILLLGLTWWFARGPAPVVERQPVSILIADFENQTGDPVFNGALEQALSLGIEGASFIVAYPRGSAADVARRIGVDPRLTEQTSRLVSRREDINFIIAGTVAAERSGYRLTARAIDPAADPQKTEPIATVSVSARTKDDVLPAVASLASQLRSELGDTTEENSRVAEAETFTAGSLEALQAYTRAQALADANKNEEALAAYRETVRLDPNFGRAYAGMGVIYTIFKDEENAKVAYEQAVKLVDRMTEREKYRTLGTYYMSVARNYEKAIENYETLVKLFPADDGGHANLGLAYLYTGNVQRAIDEVSKVLKIYPNSWAQRYNYAMYSMYAGNFDTAIAEGGRVIKEAPCFQLAFLPVALSTLAKGDFDGALGVYADLEKCGDSGAALARFSRADLEMYRGRYRDAMKLLQNAIPLDEKAENTGMLAQDHVAIAEAYLALGQRARAVAAAREAAQSSAHESVLVPAALTLLAAGDEKSADDIATQLENMLQTHTTAYARLISAEIDFRKGRYARAVEGFRDSIKRRDTWFARYLLGRLYVETKHYQEAMAELEICLKRRGEVTDVFFYDTPSLRYWPATYYWLARAQQALGVADAQQNYERFLALRSNADPADPLAADARRRMKAPAK
jgi:tetratricopeptide (TPR) repeat protein